MATLIDSYSESNQDDFGGISATVDGNAQSFTGADLNMYSAKWYIKKVGTVTVANMVAKLYAHSGTFGAAGSAPTGTALATSDPISTSTLTTSFVLNEFLFTGANQYTLVNGTHYFISIEASISTGTIGTGIDTTSPSAAGWASDHAAGGSWSDDSWDYCFYVYGVAGAPAAPANPYGQPTSFSVSTPSIGVQHKTIGY